MMKYYRLLDDINYPKRWYLGDVQGVDNWPFASCKSERHGCVDARDVHEIAVYRDGQEMDYTVSELYGIPVVSDKVLKALSGIVGFRVFPVIVQNRMTGGEFYILHITGEAICVDEENSNFEKFTKDDAVRPDLAGQYSAFFKLIVDSSLIDGKHILRLSKAGSHIIVSEEVKRRFEMAGVTGAVFKCVTL